MEIVNEICFERSELDLNIISDVNESERNSHDRKIKQVCPQ